MSDVDVDSETIEHLDFPTPCTIRVGHAVKVLGFIKAERVEPRCENRAEWAMRCRVCGVTATVCGQHRAQILLEPTSTCMTCGVTATPDTLFAFVPLKSSW